MRRAECGSAESSCFRVSRLADGFGSAGQCLRQLLLTRRIRRNRRAGTNRFKKKGSNLVGVRSSPRKYDYHVLIREDRNTLASAAHSFENRWPRGINPPAVSIADAFSNSDACLA